MWATRPSDKVRCLQRLGWTIVHNDSIHPADSRATWVIGLQLESARFVG
jgi:hypothetical protein